LSKKETIEQGINLGVKRGVLKIGVQGDELTLAYSDGFAEAISESLKQIYEELPAKFDDPDFPREIVICSLFSLLGDIVKDELLPLASVCVSLWDLAEEDYYRLHPEDRGI
jgi:hypothetical protein